MASLSAHGLPHKKQEQIRALESSMTLLRCLQMLHLAPSARVFRAIVRLRGGWGNGVGYDP